MSVIMPTTVDVARIAAITDPVLRNLQITHCYHLLARVMAERIGLEANWCAFAAWASKQAGQTIRSEDLVRAFEDFLGEEEQRREADKLVDAVRRVGILLDRQKLTRLVWKAADPEGAFVRASDAVARGNLKVFAEIGHAFARFYACCLSDEKYNEASIASFLNELRPGPPPDGQEILRQAFMNYYQALFEPQPKKRSELLFLANLQIGFHEQVRLQPEINEALDTPILSPQAFTRNLLRAYYPDSPGLADLLSFVLHTFGRLIGFDQYAANCLAGARRQAQAVVTDLLMTIELPPQTRLRLGDDLRAEFPPVLQQITNPSLQILLNQIDPTPDSLLGSGAVHWGDFDDRIHFIADMFRCYHLSGALFSPPFDPAQVVAMEEGRLPAGRL